MVASRIVTLGACPGVDWLLLAHGLARTGFALAVMGLLAVLLARTGARSLWRRPGWPRPPLRCIPCISLVIVLQYVLVGTGLSLAAKFAVCFLVPVARSGLGRLLGRWRGLLVPVFAAATFGLSLAVWPWSRPGGILDIKRQALGPAGGRSRRQHGSATHRPTGAAT